MVAAKTTFVVITEDLTQECVLNLKQSWVGNRNFEKRDIMIWSKDKNHILFFLFVCQCITSSQI